MCEIAKNEIIFSAGIQERIDFLESLEELDELDQSELNSLLEIKDDVSFYNTEWNYGINFLRDDFFVEYTKDFCEHVGLINNDTPSFFVINWEKTADNLKQDYAEVDFFGTTYLFRIT